TVTGAIVTVTMAIVTVTGAIVTVAMSIVSLAIANATMAGGGAGCPLVVTRNRRDTRSKTPRVAFREREISRSIPGGTRSRDKRGTRVRAPCRAFVERGMDNRFSVIFA
ncbi:MAG: hypothetical protein LBD64_01650, partial [Odoribacteraceae bacterium]|nr:hypothetical protein [Odoribacteraceae bacterium]